MVVIVSFANLVFLLYLLWVFNDDLYHFSKISTDLDRRRIALGHPLNLYLGCCNNRLFVFINVYVNVTFDSVQNDGGDMQKFEPVDDNYHDRISDSFARQGLMETLGATLESVQPGLVEIAMPFSNSLSQQHGFFHAGGIGSIVDTAGGYAGASLFGPNDGVLTVEFKLNLLAPADGDRLVAFGKVVKSGRTLTVTQGEVFVEKEGERKLCALMQQTLMRIVNRPDITG